MHSAKPLPRPDPNSANYWRAARAGMLSLPRCLHCGKLSFPPMPRCKYCLGEDLEWVELSGKGEIYAFCVMHADLVRGFKPPYAVIQVRLDEQPDLILTSNLLDCDLGEIKTGLRVEAVFEVRNPDITVPQFRPVRDGRVLP